MATKTKLTTYADQIAEADAIAADKAAQAREAFEEFKEKSERLADEAHEARAKLTWMQGRFRVGDETVSVEEYAIAKARHERAELLAALGELNDRTGENSSDRRIKAAERALPAMESKLARVVAEALRAPLRGITIYATFGDVPAPEESDLPVAVVSQSKPTKNYAKDGDSDGKRVFANAMSRYLIHGEVKVTLFKLPVHRELAGKQIADALRKHGIEVTPGAGLDHSHPMTAARNGYEVQELRVMVGKALDPDADPERVAEAEEQIAETANRAAAQTFRHINAHSPDWQMGTGFEEHGARDYARTL
ncbi:hypothetical protein [Streptomyces sp. B1I3]|uniref:hypothetical protein n=1 Tax=Streptomyces sp. B1I3 TaxID=3042264 RepID=UPI00278B9FF0|nr:hypothetical protein [Streptomyces sp. B1I3]MDQ0793725.1 hypothetical protein [Streptomyces sp. B1I3]